MRSRAVYVLDVDDLTDLVSDWPVETVAVGVTDAGGTRGTAGPVDRVMRIASISKLLVGLAALVALEEETISLEEPAGPRGSTVEHLLAHASGLAFDSDRMLSAPGRRRIYSNTGIEVFCRHLEERAGIGFEEYLLVGVLEPLGMSSTRLAGSPAHDIESSLTDLLVFGRELLRPSLVSAATLAEAMHPHFPDLPGILPGVGSFDPNPWGLTFEVRGHKQPHWTGNKNGPETVGHFGGTGTFLWLDPGPGLVVVALASRSFDSWALTAWPELSDAVLERY